MGKRLNLNKIGIYTLGKDQTKNGMGNIMVKALKEVVDVERIGDWIIVVKVVLGEVTMNIVLTYALRVGLVEEIKAKFREEFEGLI